MPIFFKHELNEMGPAIRSIDSVGVSEELDYVSVSPQRRANAGFSGNSDLILARLCNGVVMCAVAVLIWTFLTPALVLSLGFVTYITVQTVAAIAMIYGIFGVRFFASRACAERTPNAASPGYLC